MADVDRLLVTEARRAIVHISLVRHVHELARLRVHDEQRLCRDAEGEWSPLSTCSKHCPNERTRRYWRREAWSVGRR